jgi:trigger factor
LVRGNMLIEVKEIDYCRLNVKFEADAEQVENKRNEVIQYFKRSSVPGFRPGKATPEAIKHHFRQKIEEVMRTELAQTAYHTTVAEKSIRPFGQPQFMAIFLEGSKFKCDFSLNKLPEVELKEYKGFDIPKGQLPNVVEMSEKILQELRVRNGETIPFGEDDFIQTGDTAIISYHGFLAGEQEPTIHMEGEMFAVGQAEVEAFNENLLGMKLGERREFTTVMPENSTAVHVANKEVRFIIELNMASKSVPSALDDSLAQKVGANNVAELMNLTQGMATKRLQELERRHLNEQVAARLIQNHDFQIPTWLASFEAELLARQYGYGWADLSDIQKENFLKIASKNVKLSIILDKVRETEPDAQMSDEEVFMSIKNNIGLYKSSLQGMSGKTDAEVLETVTNSGYLPALISSVKDDFTMDFVIKNSTVAE